MATEEITISELELADEVLADMTLPVDTATETRAVTLKQLRAWLGSSLPTGFIIPAVGKISDERFTLLDGKTLSRAGTYEAFCNKVVSEVQAGNWFACSEEEYNSDVSNYGQCGKFVVSNDYIRIPTITRFIGATITLSEIGKTYKESLPNIKGSLYNVSNQYQDIGIDNGVGAGAIEIVTDSYSRQAVGNVAGYNNNVLGWNFDASRSSSAYQDGAKVQPDNTKYPYYMVISTEGQTAKVEIDINQVYEDLNLKANTSLSNLTAEGKKIISNLGMPSEKYVDLTLGSSGVGYTAPANGYFSLLKGTTGAKQYIVLNSFFGDSTQHLCSMSFSPDSGYGVGAFIPARKGDKINISYTAAGAVTYFRFTYAEGNK